MYYPKKGGFPYLEVIKPTQTHFSLFVRQKKQATDKVTFLNKQKKLINKKNAKRVYGS